MRLYINNIKFQETELEVALNNDLQQANILRAAYGDACLRLVLKKCHKVSGYFIFEWCQMKM